MNFTYKIIILLSLQIVANLVFPTSSQCQKVRVLFNDPVVLCKQYYEHDTIIKIGLTKKAIAKIKLTKCKFNQKDTNFTFHKPVLFVNSDLKTIVDFDNAVFQDTADFSSSNFEYNLECENGSFCLPVDFDSVCFVKDANFTGAVFSNNADFGDAKFSREVNFDNAKFLKNASFLHLQLTKTSKISFDNTTLPDTIDFSNNAKIAGEIDLETANFVDTSRYRYRPKTHTYKYHFIYLYQTDISKFHLDYSHFRLLLPDSTLEDSPRKLITYEDKVSLYEGLLKNFKDHGQIESYEVLDTSYQQLKWDHKWWVKNFFLSKLPSCWWNFGYDKELVFKHTFCFIIILTLITFLLLPYLNKKVYPVENIPYPQENNNIQKEKNPNQRNIPVLITILKNVLERVWYAFVYTTTIFFSLTLKVEKIKYRYFWGTIYIIVVYTLGIICLAYMANFVLGK